MSEDQRRALDEALESLAPRLSPADGPLVALLRMLADELDQGGTPAALASTYLTSLRTLYKHAGGGPRETPGATLRALRSKHGGRAAS